MNLNHGPDIEHLADDECRGLLEGCVIGRLAAAVGHRVRIAPVNYAVVSDRIVFRTTPTSWLAELAGAAVAFEVDLIDHDRHRGWSVVATGVAELLNHEQIAEVRRVRTPRPWADGVREVYVGMRWTSLEGQRIGSAWRQEGEPHYPRFGL